MDTSLLHQHTRLRIMGALYRHRDLAARALRERLGLTDGNLASHATRLAQAGFLTARTALGRDGFEVRYAITPAGSAAVREHIAHLRRILEDAGPDAGEAADPPP